MPRIFGVADFPASGAGIICNNYEENENVDVAQARNETGKVCDEWAYSKTNGFTGSGLLDDASKLPKVGEIFTLKGKRYILTSISTPRTNTGAAEVSFSGSFADDSTLHPYSEMNTPAAGQ